MDFAVIDIEYIAKVCVSLIQATFTTLEGLTFCCFDV